MLSCKGYVVVGLTGFEPAASSSRTKRATRLRYSPTWSEKSSRNGLFCPVKSRIDAEPGPEPFGLAHELFSIDEKDGTHDADKSP